jgi:hypothetical protein
MDCTLHSEAFARISGARHRRPRVAVAPDFVQHSASIPPASLPWQRTVTGVRPDARRPDRRQCLRRRVGARRLGPREHRLATLRDRR